MGVNVANRIPKKFAASALAMASLLACEIETTPEDDGGEQAELVASGDGLERAASGLTPELYGPGSSWYDYDSTTHALSPKDLVYVVRHGDALTLLELLSYYDERGSSGFFSLRAVTHDGEQWGDVFEKSLARNVKEELVCLDVATLEESACDKAAIALATAWRPLPEAGFAVKEPAFYALSHYSQPEEERIQIAATRAASLDEVALDRDALDALDPLASASMTPNDSLIGWIQDAPEAPARQDVHLQVTANMMAAQWFAKNISVEDDTISLTLVARCQKLSLDDQQPFGETATEGTVRLDATGSHDAVLVQLCDPELAEPSFAQQPPAVWPLAGQWPDTKSFDLIVEHLEGRLAIRAAPANLVYNHTLATGEGGEMLVLPLAELFEEYRGE